MLLCKSHMTAYIPHLISAFIHTEFLDLILMSAMQLITKSLAALKLQK